MALTTAEQARWASRVLVVGRRAADVQTACARAVQAGSHVVWLPAGTYEFETEVRVPGGLMLVGEGSGTLLQTQDRKTHLLSTQGDRVRFTRLKLQGADTTTSQTNDTYGITVSANQGIRIDHCELLGFSYATSFSAEATAQVDHCRIHHNLRDGLGYGVAIYSGAQVLITDNEFGQNRHSLASNGSLDWSSPQRAGRYLHQPGVRKTHFEFLHNRVGSNDQSSYELCAVDTHPGMDGAFVVEANLFEDLRHGIGIRDGSGLICGNRFRHLRTVTTFRPLVAISICYDTHNGVPVESAMPHDIQVTGNSCPDPDGQKVKLVEIGKAENISVDGNLVPETRRDRAEASPLPPRLHPWVEDEEGKR